MTNPNIRRFNCGGVIIRIEAVDPRDAGELAVVHFDSEDCSCLSDYTQAEVNMFYALFPNGYTEMELPEPRKAPEII